MKEFVLSILSGVVSSLIAFLVTTFVSELSRRDKWLISGLVGLTILAVVAVILRRGSSRTERSRNQTASGITGRKVRVKNIDVSDNHSHEMITAGNINGEDSVDVSDVTVKHERK